MKMGQMPPRMHPGPGWQQDSRALTIPQASHQPLTTSPSLTQASPMATKDCCQAKKPRNGWAEEDYGDRRRARGPTTSPPPGEGRRLFIPLLSIIALLLASSELRFLR